MGPQRGESGGLKGEIAINGYACTAKSADGVPLAIDHGKPLLKNKGITGNNRQFIVAMNVWLTQPSPHFKPIFVRRRVSIVYPVLGKIKLGWRGLSTRIISKFLPHMTEKGLVEVHGDRVWYRDVEPLYTQTGTQVSTLRQTPDRSSCWGAIICKNSWLVGPRDESAMLQSIYGRYPIPGIVHSAHHLYGLMAYSSFPKSDRRGSPQCLGNRLSLAQRVHNWLVMHAEARNISHLIDKPTELVEAVMDIARCEYLTVMSFELCPN